MRLSDSEAGRLLKDWKEERAKNPDRDSYVILRRLIRMRISEPRDQRDTLDQISEILLAERDASRTGQRVIGVMILGPRATPQYNYGQLASGEEAEDRRDRMHDMMFEG